MHRFITIAWLLIALVPGCRTETSQGDQTSSLGSDTQTQNPATPKEGTDGSGAAPAIDPPVGDRLELTKEQWAARLPANRFHILREKGTERPGTGALLKEKRPGTFHCAGCGAPLYEAHTKFESGTGWPSFYQSLEGRVSRLPDKSFGWSRVEILCARCDGHLGHVFTDGPQPTGERHCVNSLAMTFTPAAPKPAPSAP